MRRVEREFHRIDVEYFEDGFNGDSKKLYRLRFTYPRKGCKVECTATSWHRTYSGASREMENFIDWWYSQTHARRKAWNAPKTSNEPTEEQEEFSPGSEDQAEEQAGSSPDEGRLPPVDIVDQVGEFLNTIKG